MVKYLRVKITLTDFGKTGEETYGNDSVFKLTRNNYTTSGFIVKSTLNNALLRHSINYSLFEYKQEFKLDDLKQYCMNDEVVNIKSIVPIHFDVFGEVYNTPNYPNDDIESWTKYFNEEIPMYLYIKIECDDFESLTDDEYKELCENISGQCSDGWGENFPLIDWIPIKNNVTGKDEYHTLSITFGHNKCDFKLVDSWER